MRVWGQSPPARGGQHRSWAVERSVLSAGTGTVTPRFEVAAWPLPEAGGGRQGAKRQAQRCCTYTRLARLLTHPNWGEAEMHPEL